MSLTSDTGFQMSTMNLSDVKASAGIYTDFGGLAQLRAKASDQNTAVDGSGDNKAQATKEVAKQFEALFLQMMLKSMRDASQLSESTDGDQTRFYQEMFDKQIALDLANRREGVGLSEMLERDLGGSDATTLLHKQLRQPGSVVSQVDRPQTENIVERFVENIED